jgi:hypothetical protein
VEGDGYEPAILEGVACAVEVRPFSSFRYRNCFVRTLIFPTRSQLLGRRPQAPAKYLVMVSATDIPSSTTPPVDDEIATVCFNMDESLDGLGWEGIAGEIVKVRT